MINKMYNSIVNNMKYEKIQIRYNAYVKLDLYYCYIYINIIKI